MNTNIKKGAEAETLASKFLIQNGYKILKRNWTCHWGEIDIVALQDKTLVFVEVKYRSSDLYGKPHEGFTVKKRQHLQRSIDYFLKKYNKITSNWRLDLVCITKVAGKESIQHFQGV